MLPGIDQLWNSCQIIAKALPRTRTLPPEPPPLPNVNTAASLMVNFPVGAGWLVLMAALTATPSMKAIGHRGRTARTAEITRVGPAAFAPSEVQALVEHSGTSGCVPSDIGDIMLARVHGASVDFLHLPEK